VEGEFSLGGIFHEEESFWDVLSEGKLYPGEFKGSPI